MITIIDQLKTNKHPDPMLLAFEFGEINKLINVYSIEANQNKRNAKSSKRRKWADDLAEYLVNKYPNLDNTKYWTKIPVNEELLCCYRLTEDKKDYICYSKFGENDDRILRGTFRTEYIPEAKKILKKK